jgi:hypothetical protein
MKTFWEVVKKVVGPALVAMEQSSISQTIPIGWCLTAESYSGLPVIFPPNLKIDD